MIVSIVVVVLVKFKRFISKNKPATPAAFRKSGKNLSAASLVLAVRLEPSTVIEKIRKG